MAGQSLAGWFVDAGARGKEFIESVNEWLRPRLSKDLVGFKCGFVNVLSVIVTGVLYAVSVLVSLFFVFTSGKALLHPPDKAIPGTAPSNIQNIMVLFLSLSLVGWVPKLAQDYFGPENITVNMGWESGGQGASDYTIAEIMGVGFDENKNCGPRYQDSVFKEPKKTDTGLLSFLGSLVVPGLSILAVWAGSRPAMKVVDDYGLSNWDRDPAGMYSQVAIAWVGFVATVLLLMWAIYIYISSERDSPSIASIFRMCCILVAAGLQLVNSIRSQE